MKYFYDSPLFCFTFHVIRLYNKVILLLEVVMKKVLSFILINVFLILLFSGCNKAVKVPNVTPPANNSPPPVSTPTSPIEPVSDAFTVETRTENRIISSDDGKKLITIDLSFPSLAGDSESVMNFNAFYDNVTEKYLAHAEYDLKPQALEQLKMNAEQGLEFNQYSLNSDYAVTLNTKKYLSVSREFNYFTGGAHPGIELNAETFQMSNGGLMNLSDVFTAPGDTYLGVIYNEVIAQIEAPNAAMDKSNFFEDYKELVKTKYDPVDFYLSPDGVTVFYQLYSIAPYAAGVQHYTIPYDKFDGMLKIDVAKK